MTDEHRSTRLGDLLVERGAITRAQLLQAVELQQQRRAQATGLNLPVDQKLELGEILIELGFINRKELNSSLGWQKRLRKTTAVMVFIAPLLTAACGGGGGTSGTTNVQAQTSSSQAATANPGVDKPSALSSAPSSANNSSSVSSLSSSAASASPKVTLNGPVQIYWNAPVKRENGEHLDITEVGGYELRYKRTADTRYTSVNITDRYTDTYYFDNLEGEYEFQIAAYDMNGIYSPFVQIKRM